MSPRTPRFEGSFSKRVLQGATCQVSSATSVFLGPEQRMSLKGFFGLLLSCNKGTALNFKGAKECE